MSNHPAHSRGAVSYLGFVFSGLSLALFIDPNLRVGDTPAAWWAICLGMAVLAAGTVGQFLHWRWLVGNDKPGLGFWFAFALAATATTAALTLSFETTYNWIGIGSVLLLVSMVLAWRVSPLAYLALVVALGKIVSQLQHDWRVGVGVAVLGAIALAATFWLSMLIIEHFPEFEKLKKRWQQPEYFGRRHITPAILFSALLKWLPALVLAGIGFYLHSGVQNALKIYLYEGKIVVPYDASLELTRDMIEERDVERDTVEMLNSAEAETREDFVIALNDAYKEADAVAVRANEGMQDAAAAHRPEGMSTAPCQSFQFKVAGKRVSSMRGACSNLVNEGNNAVKRRYANLEARVVKIGDDAYEKGKNASEEQRAVIKENALKLIGQEFDAFRYGLRRGFQLIVLLEWIGNLALLGALVAGYQMVLGKLVFDSYDPSASFQLSEGRPQPLAHVISERVQTENTRQESINLKSLLTHESGEDRLFYSVYKQVVRSKARDDTTAPQWWNCSFQRLLSKKLILCRIDPDSTYTTHEVRGVKDDRVSRGSYPTLSVSGDSHLVAIRVLEGQEIQFRMSDLAAFSGGIMLQSIYSTHVGAFFLGLGNFQCVARGPGHLILRTIGQDVEPSTDAPFNASKLLAWDRRASFNLDQKCNRWHSPTWKAVWIDNPDLQIRDVPSCAILDQDAHALGFFQKVWRLLRYIFLPV